MKKEPRCKFCEGKHYQSFCPRKPRKTIATKKPLKQTGFKTKSYQERLEAAQKAAQRALERQKQKDTTPKIKAVRRAKISAKAKGYRSNQIRKADRIFSKYIRLRYAVDNFCTCVTCGRRAHYKTMQNGHYISRRYLATRFDEINCNVQCSYCNEDLNGNLKKYKEYLQRKYGVTVTEKLLHKAQNSPKLATYEIQGIIDLYTKKVNELLKK